MLVRSFHERLIQAVCYEVGGLLLWVALSAALFEGSVAESALLCLALTAVDAVWSPLHNTLFDRTEFRLAGRNACDRPRTWRLVHAMSHEASSVLLTLPVIMALLGLDAWGALTVDLSLTVAYAAYTFLFHTAFDWARPIHPQGSAASPRGPMRRDAPNHWIGLAVG
jgi:uncharacterized membrane protein